REAPKPNVLLPVKLQDGGIAASGGKPMKSRNPSIDPRVAPVRAAVNRPRLKPRLRYRVPITVTAKVTFAQLRQVLLKMGFSETISISASTRQEATRLARRSSGSFTTLGAAAM